MESKFNPSSPEYKKVEDLPQGHQVEFADIEDDFVKKEAVENKENDMVAGKEFSSPEITEIIARLRDTNRLDTSFEGKEIHRLVIEPFSKEEALDLYRNSGGKTLISKEVEDEMPYILPARKNLDVMVLKFNKYIDTNEAFSEIDVLGVRPLTGEELIQYGIANPSHQKHYHPFVALGREDPLSNYKRVLVLAMSNDGTRTLESSELVNEYGDGWGDGYRFPVVLK